MLLRRDRHGKVRDERHDALDLTEGRKASCDDAGAGLQLVHLHDDLWKKAARQDDPDGHNTSYIDAAEMKGFQLLSAL